MYKTSPVLVSLTPQEAEKLTDPMVVEMALYGEGGLEVNVTVGVKNTKSILRNCQLYSRWMREL